MDNTDRPHSGEGNQHLSELASLFARRGWLNQRLKLDYQGSKYWVSCSPEAFVAYRVNQDWGQSPGAPGWPVCIVTPKHAFNESDLSDRSDVATPAPGAQEWLNILSNSQFRLA